MAFSQAREKAGRSSREEEPDFNKGPSLAKSTSKAESVLLSLAGTGKGVMVPFASEGGARAKRWPPDGLGKDCPVAPPESSN